MDVGEFIVPIPHVKQVKVDINYEMQGSAVLHFSFSVAHVMLSCQSCFFVIFVTSAIKHRRKADNSIRWHMGCVIQ